MAVFSRTSFARTDPGDALILALENPDNIKPLARKYGKGEAHAEKVLTWLSLTQHTDKASFKHLRDFITANPGWPGEYLLIEALEKKFPSDLRPYDVKNWFDNHAPKTATGLLLYLDSLQQLGFKKKIGHILRDFWYKADLSDADIDRILDLYGQHLSEQDHINRANRLIWHGRTQAAKRILPLISPDRRSVLTARIMLAEDQPGVDAAIAAVPDTRKMDGGLAYERVRWRRRAGLDDSALELLNNPKTDQSLYPDKWWDERHILIRRAIEDGKWNKALSIAKKHRQNKGFSYIQAEFLVGWLTLKLEKNPAYAATIFTRFYDAVNTPMSLARGAYWAGRAFEAAGDTTNAKLWYEKAAKYPLFFYGQLANSKLGRDHLYINWVSLDLQTARQSSLVSHPFSSAVRIFTHAGLPEFNDNFLIPLLNMAKTEADFHYVAALARSANRYDFAIRAAKEMYNHYDKMMTLGYPNLPHLKPDDTTRSHLLGLIRQESIFYPKAKSHAGARGLMQLMPSTAREVAHRLGLKYSNTALTENPEYNTRLGTAYIERMLRYYDGDYVLATAAYNAGYGRVNRWIDLFGDPRSADVDVVDWIESLPVYETRNYIQRVLEAMRVYGEMFDKPSDILRSNNYKL